VYARTEEEYFEMETVDLYYLLKPLIPRKVRIALRRIRALRKRKTNAEIWPINPLAAKAPKNWAGWPEGKRFSLVLIHDVDTLKGRQNCLKLMHMELLHGFKSSFNFVPAGYEIPRELRQEIVNSGFEVGVHGLTHDGRSFRNYRTFSTLIPRINGYLKEWNSVGFTSPSMLSNLSWVANLNIDYSCSSFDTDPFEPRPYGVTTIFPFLVHNRLKNRTYVELPYTLPQDHTLFIILREPDIKIWMDKLAWVAKCGGLALLNTHPDYMDFDSDLPSHEVYPARHYADFLEHVTKEYKGQYWNCLPRSLASFWRSAYPDNPDYDCVEEDSSAANRVAVYAHKKKIEQKVKLALACASGGHFEQMQNLRDLYRLYPHFWITERNIQTEFSLTRESKEFIGEAHFKKPWTYIVQIPQVYKILKKERPTHLLSTGSGTVVLIPFLLSMLMKIKFIHIETFSHVNKLTKMGNFLLKLHQPILSQWDGVKHRKVRSIGPIISDQKLVAEEHLREDIVFVTLGTRPEGFPRIVEAVESLVKDKVINDNVVIQLGSTRYQTALMEIFDFFPPAEIDKLIASAKYVITQESAGIVTKCLKMGKRFIVMPRRYENRELPARSDMNEDLHYKLAELGFTYVVQDKEQLKAAILNIDQLKTGFRFDNQRALSALRSLIEGS